MSILIPRHHWPGGLERLTQRMAPLAAVELGATEVGSIVLYQSELRPGGPVYTPLHNSAFASVAGETHGSEQGHA